MGRPPKLKKTTRKRDLYRAAMKVVFPAQVIADLDKLSEETGISVRQVVEDVLIDSIPTIRTEVYGSLIRFRKRRGKIIREQDLQHIDGASEGAAQQEDGFRGETDSVARDAEADQGGSDAAIELPGRPPATPENLEIREGGEFLEAPPSDDDIPL